MSVDEEQRIKEEISKIIERSRYMDDRIFTDCRTAAEKIFNIYIKDQNQIQTND